MNKFITPKVAWLTLTQKCNMHCKWCYAIGICNSHGRMDIEKAKSYMYELSKNGLQKVIFIGGEPTIEPSLLELTQYAHSIGLDCGLVTNGVLLADMFFCEKLVAAGISTCNVSIKGPSEEYYINNVGKVGLADAILGYRNMEKLGCLSVVSYVITGTTVSTLEEIKMLLLENYIHQISFLMDKPSIDSTETDTTDIFTLGSCCKKIYDIFENSGIDYKLQLSIPFCVIESDILEKLMKNHRVYTCCHITKGTGIVLDAECNILPCNHFLGTILNRIPIVPSGVIDFWNSQEVLEFRKRIRCYPSLKCQNCLYWGPCGGGCFMRWMVFDPQTTIPGLSVN